MGIKRLVLISAFRLSMIWGLLTTFLGTLLILDSIHFISIGIALVGALTVGAFNFSTGAIWRNHAHQSIEMLLLKVAWMLAIAFDFWTSLTCNATYIALRTFTLTTTIELSRLFARLTIGQGLVVLFVTLLCTISPMMVGYIRERDPDFLA
jgi:hypothetical protein